MTVKQLIEKLKQFPPDALVVQSRDAEGNGFSATHEVEEVQIDSDELEGGLPATVPPHKEVRCVVLWPR
jgi:hypothetical protein